MISSKIRNWLVIGVRRCDPNGEILVSSESLVLRMKKILLLHSVQEISNTVRWSMIVESVICVMIASSRRERLPREISHSVKKCEIIPEEHPVSSESTCTMNLSDCSHISLQAHCETVRLSHHEICRDSVMIWSSSGRWEKQARQNSAPDFLRRGWSIDASRSRGCRSWYDWCASAEVLRFSEEYSSRAYFIVYARDFLYFSRVKEKNE